MADSIVTLYKDVSRTERVFPATKIQAVSDNEGTTLATLLDQNIKKNDVSGINEALRSGYLVLSEKQYGSTLPTAGIKGRVFFRVAGEVPAAEEASF